MTRFRGLVGYRFEDQETKPGVFEEVIVERKLSGEVQRNSAQMRVATSINPDVTVQVSISVIADAYARDHFHAIRYVKWAGALWTVEDVTPEHPRLLLRLGGVYNGPTAS